MDIGRAITYAFDDEEWITKVAIGAALLLASAIPLVNLFTALVVAGYSLRVLQQVAGGRELPLPNWDEWGEDWIRGAKMALAGLIYALPALIVWGLGALVGVIAAGTGDDGGAAVAFCNTAVTCLASLWGILVAIVFPAAMIKYATEGEEFGTFFRFSEIFSLIKENLGNYVVALIIAALAEVVASLGSIVCVIGVFVTAFWSTLVRSHLLGQVAAEASGLTPAPAAATQGSPDPASYGELIGPEDEQEDDESEEMI